MYKSSRGFIVTQNPIAATTVDFYRMLYETDVSIIMSFDDEMQSEVRQGL